MEDLISLEVRPYSSVVRVKVVASTSWLSGWSTRSRYPAVYIIPEVTISELQEMFSTKHDLLLEHCFKMVPVDLALESGIQLFLSRITLILGNQGNVGPRSIYNWRLLKLHVKQMLCCAAALPSSYCSRPSAPMKSLPVLVCLFFFRKNRKGKSQNTLPSVCTVENKL